MLPNTHLHNFSWNLYTSTHYIAIDTKKNISLCWNLLPEICCPGFTNLFIHVKDSLTPLCFGETLLPAVNKGQITASGHMILAALSLTCRSRSLFHLCTFIWGKRDCFLPGVSDAWFASGLWILVQSAVILQQKNQGLKLDSYDLSMVLMLLNIHAEAFYGILIFYL